MPLCAAILIGQTAGAQRFQSDAGSTSETRAYLQRKEAEGKSCMEAMRCLKPHLARYYHGMLLCPAATPRSPAIRGAHQRRCAA